MTIYAFAYLRRRPGMSRKEVRQAVREITAFIEQHGFALAGVHYESRVGRRVRVWRDLVGDCRGEGVTHVIVPSLDHFHARPELASYMRDELAQAVRGRVWVADSDAVRVGGAP
ncbi:hypothetical protein PZB75_06670 [Streptomyces sp. AM 4-1-1]|uniref:hypothetical protein n=1 Tax=Streptomyces sp. AM 4-1-1 TaxID=3028710 RepID=UPI0023B93F08|nr:hypothetical protein [Streptomyces sp. AM 4-1-1]WEH33087.1 hypothetical protein PZB75_06670 [Streptomyces sp. AM 4-1-1]